jgi:FkbM family methyltransferase
MPIHWGVNLLSFADQDIPLTHLRSANRSHDGHFDINGNETYHYIDLGAHQGESIAGFVEYLKYYNIKEKYSLTSFEASRQAQIWGPLTHTTMLSERHFSSVYVSNYAVAGSERICQFRDDGSAGASLHDAKPLNRNEAAVTVPTIDINKVIEMIPTKPNRLIIKLNIEGAEYEVLEAMLDNANSLNKITELWLDFHGHQFNGKWEYLISELRILRTLKGLGIDCYDVDFMTGFYLGYDKHPPKKNRVSELELINAYIE